MSAVKTYLTEVRVFFLNSMCEKTHTHTLHLL